jgi:predicted ATPase/transcriptional regulator with XRE-family HTH domain
MEETISFGQWIKLRRQALRLTQNALAGLAFCSAELIRKIEADARRPSPEIAERLARHLGLAPHQWSTFVKVARAELQADRLPAPAEVATLLAQHEPAVSRSLLPVPATPLLGRDQQVIELGASLLRCEVRLLTLVGAPGIGKTRLGLQVATNLRGAFADDVCFVALAPIRSPELVATAVAEALGVQELASQTLAERLKHYLRDRQVLLLLDNFEHVAAAAPLVAELLAAAAGLKALVTSRAALHLSGEHEYVVPPLRLPDLNQLPLLTELTRYAAVDLFAQRAQAIAPGFALTSANAATVVGICQRLDGLPLAIELAAARIKLLAPAALLARLDRRLSLLTGGARDLPPHQQTLRSTIDWSYDLLDDREQTLLRGLAVFVGGCTLEAAEAVCGGWGMGDGDWDNATPPPNPHPSSTILDGLAALLDKSLLRRRETADSAQRLEMLETIHEYALERLAEYGEAEQLRRRHAAYYLAQAREAQPHLWQSQQGVQGIWLARLELEHNNLRAALAWSRASPDAAEIGLALVAALWPFWLVHGHLNEGRAWLAELLALTAQCSVPSAARADALIGLGSLACDQNDYAAARAAFGECLAIARERGDSETMTGAIHKLGIVDSFQGDYAAARARIQECLNRWREAGNQSGSAGALQSLGDIAWHQGDYAAARAFQEQSLALRREVGDDIDLYATGNLHNLGRLARVEGDYGRATALCEASLALARKRGFQVAIIWALHDLGEVARDQGEYQRAVALYQESLAIAQQLGSPSWPASIQNRLAEVAQAQGEHARAGALQRASLRVFRDLGQKRDALLCLEGLAWMAEAQEHARRSAMLYGVVAALREATGAQVPPRDRASYARSVKRVRARLGQATFAAAWAEGHALPLAQAIAYALDERDPALV